jgi:hypothetical protein
MAMETSQVRLLDWFYHFKEKWMSAESDKHPECPSTSRNNESIPQMHELVWNGCRGSKFLWLMSLPF